MKKSSIDARYTIELITDIAKVICPHATHLLDVGCGAGNYTLKMLQKIANLHCTLVDLSKPMLDKSMERITAHTTGKITTIQGDIRKVQLENNTFDIILAGAVLHHLRNDYDWEKTFKKLYTILKPNGCLLVADLLIQDNTKISHYFWEKYAKYLESINGKEYQQKVLEYIEKEDSPRSMTFQLHLMQKVGF